MPAREPLSDFFAALLNRALKLDGFFPEFSAEHAARVFPRSSLDAYAAGERVIAQGDSGRDLYVICEGSVEIHRAGAGGAASLLGTLRAGDIFGEIALFREGVRSASALAAGPARIFRLDYADMEYLLRHNRALGEHLNRLAYDRLNGRDAPPA